MVSHSIGCQDGWAARCPGVHACSRCVTASTSARAETGYDGWLRYAPITDRAARERYATLPAVVVALGDSPIIVAAQDELIRGIRGMLGRTLRADQGNTRRRRDHPRHVRCRDRRTARARQAARAAARRLLAQVDHGRRQEPPRDRRAERPRRAVRRVRPAANDRPRSSRSPTSTSATSRTPRSASSTIGTISTARSSAATPAARSSGRTATSPRTSAASATTPG